MKKQITIQIDTDGKVKIEGHGFTGKSCDKKMRAFETELGSVQKRVNKPDYHQSTAVTVNQKAGA